MPVAEGPAGIALRVACAYGTVSDAIAIIAGLPPVDLMAAERAEMYREGMVAEEGDYQGQRRNRWSRKTGT